MLNIFKQSEKEKEKILVIETKDAEFKFPVGLGNLEALLEADYSKPTMIILNYSDGNIFSILSTNIVHFFTDYSGKRCIIQNL